MIGAGTGILVAGLVDAIAEIDGVLTAVAVEIVEPVGQIQRRRKFLAQVRIEIQVGNRGGLAVTVSLQSVADAGVGRIAEGVAPQESPQHVIQRARGSEARRPLAQRARAVKAERKLIALLVELRA